MNDVLNMPTSDRSQSADQTEAEDIATTGERVLGPTMRYLAVREDVHGIRIEWLMNATEDSDSDELDDDTSPWFRKLPRPDLSTFMETHTAELAALAMVDAVPRGLLKLKYVKRMQTFRQIPAIVKQIALAYPKARIAVLSQAGFVENIASGLSPEVPASWITDDSCPARLERVIVSTFAGLGQEEVEVEKLDIVLVLDATDAISDHSAGVLRFAEGARIYGFIYESVAIGLSPYERGRIEEVFGPNSILVPPAGFHQRKVQFATVKIAGGQQLGWHLNSIDLKRPGLWHNELRNRLVARLGRALQTGDASAVADFPRLSTHLGASEGMRTAVIVENAEHALRLHRKLPDWGIMCGDDVDDSGLSWADQKALVAPRWPNSLRKLIITYQGLDRTDLRPFDAIIRADGGIGCPNALAQNLITGNQYSQPLLLVDFNDRFHPALRKASRSRSDIYRKFRWFELAQNQIEQNRSTRGQA